MKRKSSQNRKTLYNISDMGFKSLNFNNLSHILANKNGSKSDGKSEITKSGILVKVWFDCVYFWHSSIIENTFSRNFLKTHTLTEICGVRTDRITKVIICMQHMDAGIIREPISYIFDIGLQYIRYYMSVILTVIYSKNLAGSLNFFILGIWGLSDILTRFYRFWTKRHINIGKRFPPNFSDIFHRLNDIFVKVSHRHCSPYIR